MTPVGEFIRMRYTAIFDSYSRIESVFVPTGLYLEAKVLIS